MALLSQLLRFGHGAGRKNIKNGNQANIPKGLTSDDGWDGRIMVNGSRSTSGSGFVSDSRLKVHGWLAVHDSLLMVTFGSEFMVKG